MVFTLYSKHKQVLDFLFPALISPIPAEGKRNRLKLPAEPFFIRNNEKGKINWNTLNDSYLLYCAVLFAIYAIR